MLSPGPRFDVEWLDAAPDPFLCTDWLPLYTVPKSLHAPKYPDRYLAWVHRQHLHCKPRSTYMYSPKVHACIQLP